MNPTVSASGCLIWVLGVLGGRGDDVEMGVNEGVLIWNAPFRMPK